MEPVIFDKTNPRAYIASAQIESCNRYGKAINTKFVGAELDPLADDFCPESLPR